MNFTVRFFESVIVLSQKYILSFSGSLWKMKTLTKRVKIDLLFEIDSPIWFLGDNGGIQKLLKGCQIQRFIKRVQGAICSFSSIFILHRFKTFNEEGRNQPTEPLLHTNIHVQ